MRKAVAKCRNRAIPGVITRLSRLYTGMSSRSVAMTAAGSAICTGTVNSKITNDEIKNIPDPTTVLFLSLNIRVLPNLIPSSAERESDMETIRIAGR